MAARQHGVVGHSQLLDAGVTRSGVDRRVAAGWLHRVHVGVFAVGHPGLSPRGRWMAATLAAGPTAVLSHRSAAALWGFASDGGVPAITAPGARRRSTSVIEVHAGRLRADEIVLFDGIPVTSVGRTLLDLGEIMPVAQLVRVIDRATGDRRLRPGGIPSVIKRATGRRGVRTLKAALLITRPQDVLTRSELERRALRLIARARLPTPEVNVRLHGHEVDLLWRDHHLVVELDGGEHHDTAVAFERDRRRDADLMAHGWRVLRLTWRQVVNDPAWVGDRLASVLHQGRAAASSQHVRPPS